MSSSQICLMHLLFSFFLFHLQLSWSYWLRIGSKALQNMAWRVKDDFWKNLPHKCFLCQLTFSTHPSMCLLVYHVVYVFFISITNQLTRRLFISLQNATFNLSKTLKVTSASVLCIKLFKKTACLLIFRPLALCYRWLQWEIF